MSDNQITAVTDDAEFNKLATAAAMGDADAFAEIYRLLVDDVHTFVRAQCDGDDICEDLVADVFLKAWNRAESQNSAAGSYRSWIFAIAKNEVRDHWRKSGRAVNVVNEAAQSLQQPVEAEPDEEATRQFLSSALAMLTDEQRDVVVLRVLGGVSTADVSRMLEKNEGAVRALQFRALRRMKSASRDGSKI